MKFEMSKVFCEDARNIRKNIKKNSVDVTITSPPYFDMKDYDHENQVGFGQNYNEYLEDLKKIFQDVFYCTKKTGSLWVIIDSFKRDGAVVPLPFDFVRSISAVGWKLQDIIIWKKDKTVPWSRKGSTRKIFEYVLFFTKGDEFKYYEDRVRNTHDLKEWWVRYPERYNPHGKSLEEIWEFSIPTQGAWGDGYIRHFCPLPEGLVQRIINLTTDEGDTVLDPFAGSGTVPAQSAFMKRKYLGFEINQKYIDMFDVYLKKNLEKKTSIYELEKKSINENSFSETIIKLRILKFGRVLTKKLSSSGIDVSKILIEKGDSKLKENHHIVSAVYKILVDKTIFSHNLEEIIDKQISIPPLSKFGITANFEIFEQLDDFVKNAPCSQLFVYAKNNTHQYVSEISKKDIKKKGCILSTIAVNVNEDIYKEVV